MVALEMREVYRRYGDRQVLNGLSLCVPEGKIYGCLGRNGVGKTTAIRIMLGLIRRDGGEVYIGGQPLAQGGASPLRRIGSIVEFPGFYPNLSGRDNLRLFQMLLKAEGEKEIDRVLEITNLTKAGNKRVKGYSLGMKQRLGLARALLGDPDLLILDEPINGLDPSGMRVVRELLRTLSRQQGKSIFLSSHILSEVEQVVDSVGIMRDGKIIEELEIDELRRKCRQGLRVVADDIRRAAEVLVSRDIACTVQNDGLLVESDDPIRVNRLLVEQGLGVSLLAEKARTLEDYFLDMTGEGGESA
jgi:ABC-type multidrug transport system ATPase subunit